MYHQMDPFRRSSCTPRTPTRAEGRQLFNDSINVPAPAFDNLSLTPSQKRHRENVTPPGEKPQGKRPYTLSADLPDNNGSTSGLNAIGKDVEVVNDPVWEQHLDDVQGVDVINPDELSSINDLAGGDNCKPSSDNVWGTASSFAEVVKGPVQFQIAIKTEPLRQFSPEDRLEFIDAVGEAIFEESDGLPLFESTTIRGNFLMVTAIDEFSFNWLIAKAPLINVWHGFVIKACSAADIPKIKKALLWIPGKKLLPTAELLNRLEKVNPSLGCKTWRVFSRKEETHGCRLLIGFEETWLESLLALKMKPFWSTVRAQITMIGEVKKRQSKVPREWSKKDRPVENAAANSGGPPISPSTSGEPCVANKAISSKLNLEQPISVENIRSSVKDKTLKSGRREGSSRKITSFLRQKSEDTVVKIPLVPTSCVSKTKQSYFQSKLNFTPEAGTSQSCGADDLPFNNAIDVKEGDVNLPPPPRKK